MRLLIILIVLISTTGFSQGNDPVLDENSENYPTHSVDLRISFWNNSQSAVSVGYQGVSVETGTGGFSGRIMYNYHPGPLYSFNVSVGILSSEVRVENLSNYTSSVIPIMIGMKYYFSATVDNTPFRPYISGSIGALIGSESATGIRGVHVHTESAVGGTAGFGSDIILGSLVKLHADICYNLFSDFEEEIGGRTNYSGPEFSFGIGFMF
ncbi:MAG: hypothetical protein PVF17_10565 [Ignavibacteria bacterium]